MSAPRKLSRRELLRWSAQAAIITVAVGCAPKPVPTTAPQPPEETAEVPTAVAREVPTVVPAPKEATKISWMTPHVQQQVQSLADTFHEQNPDIIVEVEVLPWDAFFEQGPIRLAAGTGSPDTISADVPLTASYAYRNWLLPLDEAFTTDEKADWLDAALQAGTYKGHLVTAPISTSTQILYYNPALLERGGVTPPGPDDRWTWEQLADAAKKCAFDEDGDGIPNIWGFSWEQLVEIYQLQPLPMSLGGQAIGPDGLTVRGVIDTEPWIKAFTFYSQVYNEWKLGPQGEVIWPTDLFRAQTLSMAVGGPWNITDNIAAGIEWEYGVSRHPYFADGIVVTPTGSWHQAVNATAENREAAVRFVHWFTTAAGGAERWFELAGDLPAQKSLLAKFDTDPKFAEPPRSYFRVAAKEAQVNPQPRPVTPGYSAYQEILRNTFQDIRNGAPVEASLRQAVDRIEAQMQQFK